MIILLLRSVWEISNNDVSTTHYRTLLTQRYTIGVLVINQLLFFYYYCFFF